MDILSIEMWNKYGEEIIFREKFLIFLLDLNWEWKIVLEY